MPRKSDNHSDTITAAELEKKIEKHLRQLARNGDGLLIGIWRFLQANPDADIAQTIDFFVMKEKKRRDKINYAKTKGRKVF